MPTKSVKEAAEYAADKYLGLKNVTGTGVGEVNGESVVDIYVKKKDPKIIKKIPDKIYGYKTRIKETDRFIAY